MSTTELSFARCLAGISLAKCAHLFEHLSQVMTRAANGLMRIDVGGKLVRNFVQRPRIPSLDRGDVGFREMSPGDDGVTDLSIGLPKIYSGEVPLEGVRGSEGVDHSNNPLILALRMTAAGIPVPYGEIYRRYEEAAAAARQSMRAVTETQSGAIS